MEYGDFSANADTEESVLPCQRETIPILPVRFSLPPFDLDDVRKPSSLADTGSYLVRTLRKGFVYVYVESPQETDEASDRSGPGAWHVFRFDTKGQDINSDFTPEGTDDFHRADYSFTKYQWTDPYGEEDWLYDTSVPPQKTVWVPKWASKVWLAYSEYRWPASFFRKGHDAGFRAQLMQPVNLRGSNKWAAQLSRAPELVEEYKPLPARHDPVVNARLDLSQVRFAPAQAPRSSDECAVMVALHDPLGDVRDMHFRLSVMINHAQNFASSHLYPLTIGKLCEALKEHIPARDSWYSVRTPALAEGWEDAYGELKDNVAELEAQQEELTGAIIAQVVDEENFYLGKHIALAQAQEGDPDAAGYATLLLGHGINGIGATAKGHLALKAALTGDPDELSGARLQKYIKYTTWIWSGYHGFAFDKIRQWRFTFDIVLEAVAIELASEKLSRAPYWQDWREAIQNVYRGSSADEVKLQKVQLKLKDAISLLKGTFTRAQREHLVAAITDAGELKVQSIDENPRRLRGTELAVDFPAAEINGEVKLIGGLDTERKILSIDASFAGLSIFLGMWGLFETARTHERVNELHKKGAITTVLTSKPYIMATLSVGMAEAALSLSGKMTTLAGPAEQLSQQAMQNLYKRSFLRMSGNLIYAPEVPAPAGVGRAVATWLPRVSLAFGLLFAGGQAVRGIERDDEAQIIGNIAIMAASVLLYFPATAWIGATVLAIGFVITLYQRSDLEERVRTSFWGSSEKYWDDEKRKSFSRLIQESRGLLGNYRDWYEAELQSFQDMLWKITIKNETANDNRLTIESAAFAEDDAGTMEISISLKSGQWITAQYDLSARQITSGRNTDDIVISPSPDGTTLSVHLLDQKNLVNPYYGLNIVNVEYVRPATGEVFTADFANRDRY